MDINGGMSALRSSRRIFIAVLLLVGLSDASDARRLMQQDGTPLARFGFATGPDIRTAQQFQEQFRLARSILRSGAIVRTGLGWDPTRQDVPGFDQWNEIVLEPALAEYVTVLPGIRTLNMTSGGYRWPTDQQWAHGLRQIVRMYGPGGVFQTGGIYYKNGRAVTVPPHPGFTGLFDYELWNEPNSPTGDLDGAMTPAKIAHLLQVGSEAMRAEAARMGFKINIIGPAVGGMDLDYIKLMWQADNQVFSYIDTLSIHAYSRLETRTCDPEVKRCIRGLRLIRDYLDTHGGADVHLGATEGGYAGSAGTCLGPQVKSEAEQARLSEEALNWVRANASLNVDFWITYQAIDGTEKYGHPCDSGIYDNDFWKQRLGVARADRTLKPWGIQLRRLMYEWRRSALDEPQ